MKALLNMNSKITIKIIYNISQKNIFNTFKMKNSKIKEYHYNNNYFQNVLNSKLFKFQKKYIFNEHIEPVIDKKYYDIIKSPISLSESLEKPAEKLKEYINKEAKSENKIFITAEKEKIFLENKKIEFNLPKKTYTNYLEKGMLGNAEKIIFKEVEIYFVSTIYERINLVNLYKLLNYVNPDLIQVQIKPEKIIKNIEDFYQKENLAENLLRDAWEIQPSLELKEKNLKRLLDNSILITSKTKKEEIIHMQKNFIDLNIYDPDRLSNDALSMISLWGEENKRKIFVSDSPDSLLIEKISNNNSLVYIREIYKNSVMQYPNNPDFEPRTILGTAVNLYPEIFLNISDIFISNCINKICELPQNQKPKKLILFLGYGQSKSIPNYLQFNVERSNLISYFNNYKRYESALYGEDNLEILVEKWVLIYMLLKNAGLKSNLNISSNDVQIDNLIKKYARDEFIKTGFNSENFLIKRMKHLFNELVKEKKILTLEFLSEGHKNKKKAFMKKIYNDPILNSQLS